MAEAKKAAHEAERAAFHRWYVGNDNPKAKEIARDQHGSYILMQTRLAWQAYHAGWLREGADGVPGAGKTTDGTCNGRTK